MLSLLDSLKDLNETQTSTKLGVSNEYLMKRLIYNELNIFKD